jgi:mRNA interferase MazF
VVWLAVGDVVLVPFPFSDLSQSKLRPAIALADADGDDWILCQVTSNPYGDSRAIAIAGKDFSAGGLPLTSYARPGKIFTGSQSLVVRRVGKLRPEPFARLV